MAKLKKKDVVELPMELEMKIDDSNKFVARLSEFQGAWRLDVRKHIETPKFTGFTKDGINLKVDRVEDLLVMINALHETIVEKGLDKLGK